MMSETEPPNKKPKMQRSYDEFIEQVMKSETNLFPIVSDVYTNILSLTECYAGYVADPKQISRILQVLNDKLPLNSLQHLKRVNRRLVIICLVSQFHIIANNEESIQDYLDKEMPELKNIFEYIKIVDVPATPPVTVKQNQECRYKWPCNFHPSMPVENLLRENYFKKHNLSMHRTYMGMALEVIRISKGNMDIFSTEDDFKLYSHNAAIVVDPDRESVVAVALDNRIEHPTQHATMVAIDNVAKTQNGGAWDDVITKETIFELRKKFSQVQFGARKFVSKKEETDDDKADNSPYLCTGYDVYLVREPCVMCAMALVHARIKRVFYMFENSSFRVLHSTKLHCVPYLNHRFLVFTGFDK